MPWYVYGIVRADDAPPPAVSGLDGEPVQLIVDGMVAAAVGVATDHVRGLEGAEPEAVLAAVRTHDDVVAALAGDRAVLPVRFGTVLPDDDAMHALLRDETWTDRLDHVAGADEWVLTVTTTQEQVDRDAEPAEALSPGHAFFARRRSEATARQQARRRAVAVAEELHDRLLEVARDWRVLDLREPDVVGRGAYLLPRDAVDHVEHAVAGVTDAAVVLQGPLPPYRFTDR